MLTYRTTEQRIEASGLGLGTVHIQRSMIGSNGGGVGMLLAGNEHDECHVLDAIVLQGVETLPTRAAMGLSARGVVGVRENVMHTCGRVTPL